MGIVTELTGRKKAAGKPLPEPPEAAQGAIG
jgi:hypothetical protein